MGQHLGREKDKAEANPSREGKSGSWNMAWLDPGESDVDLEDSDNYLMVLDSKTAFRQPSLDKLVLETYFERGELFCMYRAFRKDCPTGELHEDEFQRFYKKFFPGDAADYAHFVFRNFDEGDNGSIGFEQFIRCLSVSTRGDTDEKLQWAFKLYDVDRDGEISREDMLAIVTSIYKTFGVHMKCAEDEKTPEMKVTKLFRLFAPKGDKITLAEFIKACKKLPQVEKGMNILTGLL